MPVALPASSRSIDIWLNLVDLLRALERSSGVGHHGAYYKEANAPRRLTDAGPDLRAPRIDRMGGLAATAPR
jgi:hypothetical protein